MIQVLELEEEKKEEPEIDIRPVGVTQQPIEKRKASAEAIKARIST